jgi:hypothetical protein
MNEEITSPPNLNRAESPTETPSRGTRQMAKETTETAQTEIEKLKDTARKQGSAVVEEIKTLAQSAVKEVQDTGGDFVHEQKENLAQKVAKYGEALHATSERLRTEEGNVLADPTQKAADQLERVSSYLHEKEPADFLEDLEAFTRRRPEVVFGGLFVAGLAAARFFKASRRRPRSTRVPEPAGDVGTVQLSAAAPISSPIPAASEPLSAPSAFPPAPSCSPATAPTSSTP